MTKHYVEVKAKADFVEIEKDILKFWEENDTFQKSVKNRENNEEFVFYDGPPFANGTPHYGHIMISYVKDVVARFQTMDGKKVERRLGWDCHGLPAEMSAEQQLGVSGRKQIEEYGVEKFNNFCRQDVLKYANIWTDMFKRIGRWVEFGNDYRTMDLSFMESCVHNFKQLYDKGLVYEDYRVLPYSWSAETPLSNFEVNLGYQDKTDDAITIMFKLENGSNILVWTTTPWTLPSNLMLAVGKDIEYAIMEENSQKYIIAKALLPKYKKQLEHASETGTIKGSELVGLSYEPLFNYFSDLKENGAFKVISGDFVSTEDGTGVVHIAPGFGQDDFDVCRAYQEDFPVVCPVDEAGKFTAEVKDFEGVQVFDTNDTIISRLKERGLLVKKEQYTHSYPMCWRTDKPLIYKAMSSWFVRVTDFRDDMVKNNQEINWVPDHVKDGRFGKWLEGARDWSISRNRFWGTPIPVWKSDNPDFPRVDVLGSIAEIKEKTGFDVTDLHKPYIDDVIYKNPDDPSGKTMMRRVPDVFDCWFESGSMPYAQIHYPFENKQWFESHFPADFIVEAMDQTRGWFYTLTVLSTALFNKPAFKNCICTGLLMAEGGQKLSKRLKNYPDPNEVLETTGSDVLRWFLVSSPVLKGGNLAVDKEGKEITKAARTAQIPLWNAFYFFTLYANAESYQAKEVSSSTEALDNYILSKLKNLVSTAKKGMESYDFAIACQELSSFMEVLNNWYIRRTRDRFWEGDSQAFDVLYTVLINVSKIMAPFMPFLTEYVYKSLTGEESVHLTDYPSLDSIKIDNKLVAEMDFLQDLCSAGKNLREEKNLRNRLPLSSLTVVSPEAGANNALSAEFISIIKDELNVKNVLFDTNLDNYANKSLYLFTPLLGKALGKGMGSVMAAYKQGIWSINDDDTVTIAEQKLTKDLFEIRLNMKEGVAGKSFANNKAIVTLDTNLTDELKREGMARDFIRLVQTLRKDKDFNVSDRIELSYSATDAELLRALEENKSYVMEQVLATKFDAKDLDNTSSTASIEGLTITYDAIVA